MSIMVNENFCQLIARQSISDDVRKACEFQSVAFLKKFIIISVDINLKNYSYQAFSAFRICGGRTGRNRHESLIDFSKVSKETFGNGRTLALSFEASGCLKLQKIADMDVRLV